MPAPKTASELDDLTYLADYASATVEYYGHASPGSATTSAVWRIRRRTLDANGRTTAIEWAGRAGNFDQICSDRATAVYA